MTRTFAMKQNTFAFLSAVWLTLFSASSVADDTEIFNPPPGNPKVLFVLDASRSMQELDGGTVSRLDRLKSGLKELIENPELKDVDVGMMTITNPVAADPTADTAILIHPVVPIENNRANLVAASNAITLGVGSQWGTPTTAALHEAGLYFRGEAPYRGATLGGTTTYDSPLASECDSAHIVMLSDGRPTVDNDIVNHLQAPPYNYQCVDQFGQVTQGLCGPEVVEQLHTIDQFPLLEGNQFIDTYTIGFNVKEPWIIGLAEQKGGGQYKEAESAADIVEVFNEILREVTESNVFSAPAIPVNQLNTSRDSNELFYSLFQSNRKPRWEGNVKKYLLKDGIVVGVDAAGDDILGDGVIVDADDNPLVVDGAISPTSRSLWSNVADGANVADGGMAALQPAGRKWYTDADVTPEVDNTVIPRLVTAPGDITPASLGATAAEAESLVNWVLGRDSIDRDGDGDLAEPNFYVGDSLHSSPVVVTYEFNADTNVNKRALFMANNMGVLHAIDPEDGTELWSYSPEELLPNIKAYVDNDSAKHVYGLDGQMVLDSSRSVAADGTVVTDMARLYLSQRRGGNNIIALDVSDALDTAAPFEVMWKINGDDAGFGALAQTWSTPQLINIKTGCPANCTIQEVLMFSGGYNADVYDNKNLTYPVTPAAQGHGNAIYMVDPVTGALVWSAGDGAGYSLDLEILDSVPETPVPVDYNADGAVDILFFSDIAGHVWRVDLDDSAANSGDIALAGGMIADLTEVGQTLRFFNRPDVVLNGTTIGLASFSIVMGSGMRSSPLFEEPDNNRVFSFIDAWPFNPPVARNPITDVLESEYRYVESATGARSVITPYELVEHGETYSNNDGGPYGFYRELEPGEKILEETLTTGGRIFLTSYAPLDAKVSCQPATGESRLYVLDLFGGDNLLPGEFGNPYFVLSEGISPPLDIVDTGDAGGPTVVAGKETVSLEALLEPDVPNSFRRFIRTGWIEVE